MPTNSKTSENAALEAINSMSVVDKIIYEAEERVMETKAIKTAVKMLEKGFSFDQIADLLELSVERIKDALATSKHNNQ